MPGIAEKINRLRSAAQMTQSELADRLEVSRQTVSKWELGAAQPELDKVVALSELFQVSTDYLLKREEPREPEISLDRLVLRFLGYSRDINTISDDLLRIMRDGVIDENESLRMHEIVVQLNAVSQMIEELRYFLLQRGERLI